MDRIRQARTGAKHCGGGGTRKTTENKIDRPRWHRVRLFLTIPTSLGLTNVLCTGDPYYAVDFLKVVKLSVVGVGGGGGVLLGQLE